MAPTEPVELSEEEESKMQEAMELLEEVKESTKETGGRLEDRYIIRFYRMKMLSMPCQNQGFILDGFPKTIEQAQELFKMDEDEEEEEEEEKRVPYHKKLMPEQIVALDAGDRFLRERIMALSEAVVHGTHNTEEDFTRRLTAFRTLNTDEDTLLNYFDELELNPVHFDVEADKSAMMRDTVEKVKKLLGPPRNYGPTPEERERQRLLEEEARVKHEEEERATKARQREEEMAERRRRQDEWRVRLEDVRREEIELLEVESQPLRNYLMQHVMPTLSQGLMECVRARPDDPIDFLAEFLFHHNTQIH